MRYLLLANIAKDGTDQGYIPQGSYETLDWLPPEKVNSLIQRGAIVETPDYLLDMGFDFAPALAAIGIFTLTQLGGLDPAGLAIRLDENQETVRRWLDQAHGIDDFEAVEELTDATDDDSD